MTHATMLGIWYFWPIPFVAVAETISFGGFPFGSLTSTGILCWYVWHTNSKALPRIDKAHSIEKHEMRDHYQSIIKSQVQANKESSQLMASALEKLSEAIGEDK